MYAQTQANLSTMLYQVTHGAANKKDWDIARDNITFTSLPVSLHDAPEDVPLVVVSSELLMNSRTGIRYSSKVVLGGSSLIKLSTRTARGVFRSRAKTAMLDNTNYIVCLEQTYSSQSQGTELNVPLALKSEYIYCNTEQEEYGMVIPLNHILQKGKPLLSSEEVFEFSGILKVFNLFCSDAYCYDSSHGRTDIRYRCHLKPDMKVDVTLEALDIDSGIWKSSTTFQIYPDYTTGFPKLNSQSIIDEFIKKGNFWTSQLGWYKNLVHDLDKVEELILDVEFESFYKTLYEAVPIEVILYGGFGLKSNAAYLLKFLGEETYIDIVALYQDGCLNEETIYDILPLRLYSQIKSKNTLVN